MKTLKRWYGAALLVLGSPALAHHSFAMYDPTQVLTLSGTVKEFQWSNPHAIVWVYAPELWTIELPTSPAGLVRMGWDKHSLNSGDHVILEINPLRGGQHGGSFRKATIVETGKVLTVASPLAHAAATLQTGAP
jgi:hypothetical protein